MSTTSTTNAASKGGAPRGNANAFSSGLRGSLTLGSVPKKCSYVRKLCGRFRREVENAALDVHGSLGLFQLALAQSATRHEMRCLYASRALREQGDKLPLADRLKLMDTIGAATDSRDKCLSKLGLDKPVEQSPWDEWDQHVAHQRATQAAQRIAGSNGTSEPTSSSSTSDEASEPDSDEDHVEDHVELKLDTVPESDVDDHDED